MAMLEPVLISSLAQYSYCPRRCALIYVESLFDENLFTLRGTGLHERADQPIERVERGIRVERALPLWSDTLGLTGRGDIVEWRNDHPFPVEYKSGKPVNIRHGAYQVCAQALCLEEMTGKDVPEGALYFFETRERIPVKFDLEFREEVLEVVVQIRKILSSTALAGDLPPPVADKRCRNCSLNDACMPFAVKQARMHVDQFGPRDEAELP